MSEFTTWTPKEFRDFLQKPSANKGSDKITVASTIKRLSQHVNPQHYLAGYFFARDRDDTFASLARIVLRKSMNFDLINPEEDEDYCAMAQDLVDLNEQDKSLHPYEEIVQEFIQRWEAEATLTLYPNREFVIEGNTNWEIPFYKKFRHYRQPIRDKSIEAHNLNYENLPLFRLDETYTPLATHPDKKI